MNQEKIFTVYQWIIIAVGTLAFIVTTFFLESLIYDWKFTLFVVFTLLTASRMKLQIPRSNLVLNFSDSMIFLAFLVFDGFGAVVRQAVGATQAVSRARFLPIAGDAAESDFDLDDYATGLQPAGGA